MADAPTHATYFNKPILLDGDGSQVREPVYVDDVIGAIKASAQS